MLLPLMRDRMLTALLGVPDVLDALFGSLESSDPRWDARPDPERFTLREIMAHLADYEAIWLDRIIHTQREDCPALVSADPATLAVENDYAHIAPNVSRARFRERRAALADFLCGLTPDDWPRVAQLSDRGPLTLEEQAAFAVIHDGYHTAQVAHWLAIRDQNVTFP